MDEKKNNGRGRPRGRATGKYVMKNKKDGRGRPKGSTKIITEEEKITKAKKLLEYQREYYIKNRDRILKNTKEYQNHHRQSIRDYNMRYYYNHGGKYTKNTGYYKDKLTANLIKKQITLSF